jgi:hypothetical protein
LEAVVYNSNFVYEYRQFSYKHDGTTYVLLLDNEPLIAFPERALMEQFCDHMHDIIQEAIVKKGGLALHITGCARCRRTYEGTALNPCQTGIPLFINAKNATVDLMKTAAASLIEWREGEGREEAEKLERENVQ